jgi:ribonuclease HI
MEKQLDLFSNERKKTGKSTSDSIVKSIFDGKKVTHMEEWDVFIDGAARGNPGPSGAGIYVIRKSDKDVLIKNGFFLGHKTNNQAEYLALLLAVFLINEKRQELKIKNIVLNISSDSELLVRQMCGLYKIKNEILQHIKCIANDILINFSHKFIHILREKNKIADRLANLGVDKRAPLPKNFLDFAANYKDVIEIL